MTLPAALIAPVANTLPDKIALSPIKLPDAFTIPVFMFCEITLPDEETTPAVVRFPPTTFPVAVRLASVPTVVKLAEVTLALSTFPVNNAALA